ncbi:MAG: hypothetical protein GXY82_03620 [Methanospirillum sp.]|nr:hypothetical protein [Methanospirillum sp.]
MEVCPRCGRQVLEGLDRCPFCRAPMDAPAPAPEESCMTCGTPTPTNARFCPGFGRRLPVEDAGSHPISYAAGWETCYSPGPRRAADPHPGDR